jgi:hypothetical protein
MKKVWILEKFATAEEEAKHYNDFKELLETAKKNNNMTEEQISQLNESLANFKKIVDENPDGRWYGFEGKVIYRQFCDVAKAAIRRNPDGKFRVVEAEIDDDAQYWTGYNFVKVNDGVYRYLMATK